MSGLLFLDTLGPYVLCVHTRDERGISYVKPYSSHVPRGHALIYTLARPGKSISEKLETRRPCLNSSGFGVKKSFIKSAPIWFWCQAKNYVF